MTHPMLSLVATTLAASALVGAPRAGHAQDCSRFRGHSVSVHGDGDRSVTRLSTASRCLEIVTEGVVEFTDDDADVLRLSPGGRVVVEETRGGTRRRLEIEERGGRLERSYRVDGTVRAPAEAAAWLREVIPTVARESVAGAERRADRVLRTRGARGVFDEVALIASDRVKSIYLTRLLDAGRQPADVLRETARAAGERMVSDRRKGEVLRRVVARSAGDAGVLESVAAAAGRIVSDAEKAQVLLAAVAATNEARVHVAAATVATRIVSDGRRGDVLAELAARADDTDALRGAYFRAVDGMVSDRERARALLAVARRPGVGAPSVAAALRSARRLTSDGAKATVLVALASHTVALRDSTTRATFFDALRTVSSSGEYRRVMEAVIQ